MKPDCADDQFDFGIQAFQCLIALLPGAIARYFGHIRWQELNAVAAGKTDRQAGKVKTGVFENKAPVLLNLVPFPAECL